MNQATTRILTPSQRERRQRILQAARIIIGARGYQGMIMRDVAEAAGVSPTTLYNLYNTKDELLLAALRDAMVEIWSRSTQQTPETGLQRLLLQLKLSAQQTHDLPTYARAITQALQRAQAGDQIIDVLYRGVSRTIERSLAAMVDARQLAANTDIASLAMALTGGFWGVYELWSKELIDTDQLENELMRSMVSMLLPLMPAAEQNRLNRRVRSLATR